MNSDNELQEQRTLEDDTVRLAESVEDLALNAEYNEHLRKIRTRWRAAALTSILVFLMIVLYGCGSTKHSDTIVPKTSQESETTVPPVADEVESIEFYEYVIKADGVTPDFTDDLLIPDIGGVGWVANTDAIDAYSDIYAVNWIIEKGDDNFTAERKAGEKKFKSNKPYSFTDGGITRNIYGEAATNSKWDIYQAFICDVPEEMHAGGISTIAVILPEFTSEEDIENGISTFFEKFKGLNWRFDDEQARYHSHDNGWRVWDIIDKSQEDMAQMLGDSFGVQGRELTCNPDVGDIRFLGEEDKTTVESEYIENGNKIVFVSLEWFAMNSESTAAYYSKYLQGDSSLKIFDNFEDLNNYLKEVYK